MVSLCLRQISFAVVLTLASSAFAETNAPLSSPTPAPESAGSPTVVLPAINPPAVPAAPANDKPQVFANQDLQLRVSATATDQLLQIRGVLYPRDAGVVADALALLKADQPLTVAMTNFGGGTYGPIIDLIDSLTKLCSAKTGCLLKTVVHKHQSCSSNCITVFMMGAVREASEDAAFGFHEASNGPNPAPGACERGYALAGVSEAWMKEFAVLFASTKITKLKPDQMIGSNIVTEIVRDGDATSAPTKTEPVVKPPTAASALPETATNSR